MSCSEISNKGLCLSTMKQGTAGENTYSCLQAYTRGVQEMKCALCQPFTLKVFFHRCANGSSEHTTMGVGADKAS